MESLVPLIIQAVAGAIGGLGVSAAMKQAGMSIVTKVIAGVVGGIGGGQILHSILADPTVTGALSGVVGDALGGVVGGGVLTAIAGVVMGSMNKR
jgi:hypothetical protein